MWKFFSDSPPPTLIVKKKSREKHWNWLRKYINKKLNISIKLVLNRSGTIFFFTKFLVPYMLIFHFGELLNDLIIQFCHQSIMIENTYLGHGNKQITCFINVQNHFEILYTVVPPPLLHWNYDLIRRVASLEADSLVVLISLSQCNWNLAW